VAEKLPGAYVITHEATGLFYVGSSGDLAARESAHRSTLKSGLHHSKEFQEAYNCDKGISIAKIPSGNRERAYDLEQLLLDQHRNNPKMVNALGIARVGDINKSRAGTPLSEETKRKMSDVRKGRSHSEEHARAISDSLKGKPKSAEHIAKVVEARKDFKHSDETKAKIAAKVKATKAAKKAAMINQSEINEANNG
jgi:group I intron endonuclease